MFRVQGSGFEAQGFGSQFWDLRFWGSALGCRASDFGFESGVYGLWSMVYDFCFRALGSGLRAKRLNFRVRKGFRVLVSGFWFRV